MTLRVQRFNIPREGRKTWHAPLPAWIGLLHFRNRINGIYARVGRRAVSVYRLPNVER